MNDEYRSMVDDADHFSVVADERESRGEADSMRSHARMAARRYEMAAERAANLDKRWRAAELFTLASDAYRRGHSYKRAVAMSDLAAGWRRVAHDRPTDERTEEPR